MEQPNGNEKLRFNRATNCYETTIVIKVEAEIFQRAFFRYVEENHVDITDTEAMQRAIDDVSRVVKWVEHPRTQKVITPTTGPLVGTPIAPEAAKPNPEGRQSPPFRQDVSQAEAAAIREKALNLPVDEWEEKLLTPLPLEWNAANRTQKNSYYQRRYGERKVLQALKKELETPLSEERIEAIAGAVNGVRFH